MKLSLLCSIVTIVGLVACQGASAQTNTVDVTFIGSGVTERVGGYRPHRAEMNQDADIVSKVPEDLQAPKFGKFTIGKQNWVFILDEPEEGDARLFIDTNGDGDLTNDPEVTWTAQTNSGQTMYQGKGQIDVGDGNLGTLGLYRFDPSDERRASLKNTLMYYFDYGYEISFKLDGQEFSSYVAGSLEDASVLPIDRDGNGKISNNFERTKIGEPFNFTGTPYQFSMTDGQINLEEADVELAQLAMPPDLSLGKQALEFTATTMEGAEIEFPSHFAGKLVMLDFWATWCGPCIAEIPHMKQAYKDWNEAGFEILGISFDAEGASEKVSKFLEDRELTWPQIYEGKAWETELGKMHDVSGIPFVLLIDGDTGEILGTARQLRGDGLSEFIGTQLRKKGLVD